MCGIVAYWGNGDGAKIVLEGLKKLEYRGYDSWGIAERSADKILVHKQVGKIGQFDAKDLKGFTSGGITIGHTRWATHGGVTKENSHPHLSESGRFAVVHNGIIENYQELRGKLEKAGFKFVSQTDTEAIPQLIEFYIKKGKDFKEAVKATLCDLEGSFAIAAIDLENETLIGARKGSPLILGIGESRDEYFLGSDVPAFLKETNKVVFLDEYNLVVIAKGKFKVLDLRSDKEITPKATKISWNFEDAEKGGYPNFMIKEMMEQPTVLEKTWATDRSELEKAVSMLKKAENIYVVACGTALHAGMWGSYLLGRENKLNLRPISAGEFPYFAHLITKKDLMITVSQSGETADVLEAVKTAKSAGTKILALVNVMGSSLMRLADHSLLTKAGPEICVLSTKAYVSQLGMFVMLSEALKGNINNGKVILSKVKKDIEKILASQKEIKKLAVSLSKKENIYAIGRGFNYPTSLEACLKIKEVSYIHAEGFAGGDLKHGPIALIEKNVPVIVFLAQDGSDKEIISNAMEVKARGAEVIGIAPVKNEVFDTYLPVLDNGIYTGISAILYGQILAYYIAIAKKLDPDKPRNLAKSVTVK